MNLIAQPKEGFKNTKYIFKIVDEVGLEKGRIYEMKLKNLKEGSEKILSKISLNETIIYEFNQSGDYEISVETDSKFLSARINVKDALILGGGKFKKSYVFENIDLVFMVLSDRTLVFSTKNVSETPITLHGVSPSNIHYINSKYLLFEVSVYNYADNKNVSILNTTTFDFEKSWKGCEDVKKFKIPLGGHLTPVFCYSCDDKKEIINISIKSNEGSNEYLVSTYKYTNILCQESTLVLFEDLDGANCILDLETNSIVEQYDVHGKPNHYLDLVERLVFTEKDGNLFFKGFGQVEYSVVKDFKISNLKNSTFPTIEQDGRTAKDYDQQLKTLALEKVIDVEPGDFFTVELIDVELTTKEIYFKRIGLVNVYTTESITKHTFKADCRKSKYHNDIDNVLWVYDLKGIKDQLDECSFFFDNVFKKGINYTIKSHSDLQAHIISHESEGDRFCCDYNTFSLSKITSNATIYKYHDIYCIIDVVDDLITVNNSLGNSASIVGHIVNKSHLETHGLLYIESIETNHDFLKLSFEKILIFSIVDCKFLNARRKISIKDAHPFVPEENNVSYGYYDFGVSKTILPEYNKCEHDILVSLAPFQIKSSVVGVIRSFSSELNKVVTANGTDFRLWVFNKEDDIYYPFDLDFSKIFINKAFLHPEEKIALITSNNSNEIRVFDIETETYQSFFTGRFLAFDNTGNIVLEEDRTRKILVYDPKTFEKISTSQFHHYKFLSPDEKLYSNLSTRWGLYHRLLKKEISQVEYSSILEGFTKSGDESNEDAKRRIKKHCDNLSRRFSTKVSSIDDVVSSVKYLTVGIVNTEIITEIPLHPYMYFNYLAFSADNSYIGVVGKPNGDGLFQLIKLNYNEPESTISFEQVLSITDPHYATWTCGFSSKSYFATSDSNPSVFILKVNENTFMHRIKPIKIEKKSYLCFNNEGNMLALSARGYDPISMGGRGHQDSRELYLADVETGNILYTFGEHGGYIDFAAFSADDKRILTRGDDGVVIIRNFDL